MRHEPCTLNNVIEIDGTMGEGGGQVLRSTLSLSLLTGRPVHLVRIRAGRDRPGMAYQHLMAVQSAARIGRARVEGDRIGSQELRFSPGRITPGDYHFDIGTAGATSLVLQTLLLPLALAEGPSRLQIRGGTHVPWSPCFHYLDWHWRVILAQAGIDFELRMPMAGFYPAGGGELQAAIPGHAQIRGIHHVTRGRLLRIKGLSAVANLPEDIAERQRRRAMNQLQHLGCPIEIALENLPAASPGTVLVLLTEFEHAQVCCFALGARGKRAERVADEAVAELLHFLATDSTVDRWLADQLLLPLSFANAPSVLHTSEVTLHLQTQAEVIQRFMPARITIDGNRGEAGRIHIDPAGSGSS